MDYEGIAATLLGFEEDYQPVTVCLYWKDILLGRHELFRRRGLKVVSAGHLYDTYFFWRFYHLCSRHRYAASNTYSSALLYAVESGCSFFFSESFGFREVAAESVKEELKEAKEPEDRLAAIKALFAQPRPAATPEQLEMVDYYLGTAYLRSPAELRRQFLQAEKWDKTLFYVRHSNGRRKFFLPTYYRRKVDYLIYLAKNLKTALKDRLRGYGHRWPALSRWLGLQR
jgi:hypothetical protein